MLNFIKPTKFKVMLAIMLFLAIFTILMIKSSICPAISRICNVSSISSENSLGNINKEYPKNIPLSCDQACSESEYNSQLNKNIRNLILFKILILILLSYLLAGFIVFIYEHLKQS